MAPGESMEIGNYEFVYEGLKLKQDDGRVRAIGSVSVTRGEREIATMEPTYDYWFSYRDSFAEVAVRSTPIRDIFVSLIWTTYDQDDKRATFRILINPMVMWIWAGGGLFLLGGALSFWGEKR
jgi:cytochrome c-type biogenesis protein CcmF